MPLSSPAISFGGKRTTAAKRWTWNFVVVDNGERDTSGRARERPGRSRCGTLSLGWGLQAEFPNVHRNGHAHLTVCARFATVKPLQSVHNYPVSVRVRSLLVCISMELQSVQRARIQNNRTLKTWVSEGEEHFLGYNGQVPIRFDPVLFHKKLWNKIRKNEMSEKN